MGIEQTGNGGGKGPLLVVIGGILLALVIYFGSLQPPVVDEPPRPWHSKSTTPR